MPIWFILWMILSFAWLGYETKWLTIRLPYYIEAPQSQSTGIDTYLNRIAHSPSESTADTIPYKPTEFIAIDMPETAGNLSIICVRE